MKTVKGYGIIKTQSPDGEIHLILSELKLNNVSNDRNELNDAQIKEIMKREAKKPLLLTREYE